MNAWRESGWTDSLSKRKKEQGCSFTLNSKILQMCPCLQNQPFEISKQDKSLRHSSLTNTNAGKTFYLHQIRGKCDVPSIYSTKWSYYHQKQPLICYPTDARSDKKADYMTGLRDVIASWMTTPHLPPSWTKSRGWVWCQKGAVNMPIID